MDSVRLPGFKSSFIGKQGKLCSVEKFAIQYYQSQGWKAMVILFIFIFLIFFYLFSFLF